MVTHTFEHGVASSMPTAEPVSTAFAIELSPTTPLVSCIMPTHNRRTFLPQAIAGFQRQDYPWLELIVVDDGSDPIADCLPDDARIRYVRLDERRSIGAKRNLACSQAQGEIIAHWDDDDWYPGWRISTQVEALRDGRADLCGSSQLLYRDPLTGQTWRYACTGQRRPWVAGNTLAYRKAFWMRYRFANCSVGEDARFIWRSPKARVHDLSNPHLCVATLHAGNTAPKHTAGPFWHPIPGESIRILMSGALQFEGAASARKRGHLDRAPGRVLPPSVPERGPAMLTVAHEADLALPEFKAYNAGQALPWMRRWELPYVLSQLRLDDTAAVLDCTINPCGFGERLQALYPHVLYRHWSPIQAGRFAVPFGVPEAAFDRVVCVNTLEHLLASQREELIATIAGKLKPGGLLVFTSDSYFPSAWSDPAFLHAGVMRADGHEIFNGWNKVSIDDWLALGARHGLTPIVAPDGTGELEPREEDATLYRNVSPFPHAALGGVFCKGAAPQLPEAKTVLLSLLAWNTRDVTVDSVRALVHEARLLQRMGHNAAICVCDNGSTDETVEAVQALEPEIDVPYRLLVNPHNLGNSVARNQILDVMREIDADYTLFMDGDIEAVPFSSFAMLRYMQNCGRGLGCIGADSAGQTRQRDRVSQAWYAVDPAKIETTNLVAWTQYGLFRREVFDNGVRFDEAPPFDQAGWGFEDNDLAFQIEMKGYRNQRFFGMTYLHRDPRSSVRNMRQEGIDPQRLYLQRQQYVVDKWAGTPHINSGPLHYVRRIQMRL